MKVCGDDAGIVEDEDIAGFEIRRKIGEALMFKTMIVSMKDEEPRVATTGRGMLRDELGRQIEAEVGSTHRYSVMVHVWGFKPAHRKKRKGGFFGAEPIVNNF